MSGGRVSALAAVLAAGALVALLLAGLGGGLALLVYVLSVGALVLLLSVTWLRAALPSGPRFDELTDRRVAREARIQELERMERLVSAAGWNMGELHYRLRPAVREVLTARLSRRHGVELDREPNRARALVGDGPLWELARPDREPPEDRHARGWPSRELERLLDQLERV